MFLLQERIDEVSDSGKSFTHESSFYIRVK
ncbi:hypothetical protein SAMN05216317_12317 [Nitrosomonas eutropha]|nr:hypothetical protein SAMN05216379_13117 [Nitrosomonas eutropha]SDX01015.1 hypothetical protein SAMN05216317_12317 [Nitrosomonas eutropha]